MAWEVALAVGGSLTAVAVVVIVVMLVAMCAKVSRHHCKHKICSLIESSLLNSQEDNAGR